METVQLDPLTTTVESLIDILADITNEDRLKISWMINLNPKPEYGDLSIPLIRFTRKTHLSPEEFIDKIIKEFNKKEILLSKWEHLRGYLNLWLNTSTIVEKLAYLYANGWRIQIPRTRNPKKIVVEHTSANPIHQLHTGHARNTSIGDTLSRMLKARGHTINRRYYIDDVGKQVAILAFGVEVLGIDISEEASRLRVKNDHLSGWIYATTHTILDVLELREKLERVTDANEKQKIQRKIDDLMLILADLKEKDPDNYFDKLLENIPKHNSHKRVQEIMTRYEKGLEPEKSLVRKVASAVLEGIKETLARLGVAFDDWDWESDLVWSSRVGKLLEKARKSKYYTISKGAEALDIPRIIKEVLSIDLEAKKKIKLPKGYEIPPLILVRSDGTTLYTTRDMAYTIYKFEKENQDTVINVIGADQRLAQLQLRLGLLGLGYRREALNLIHYDYEIVRLPGMKMSSRKGRLISLDSVIDSLKSRAILEVKRRNPDADAKWIEETAEKIAVGATRFTLVRTNAKRPIVFDLDRALNLEENSGPYLQYTYARANSILMRHGPIDYSSIDPTACNDDKRRSLLINALKYPLIAAKAADDLAPEDLASYLLYLADLFNSWYQVDTVIHEHNIGYRECKALIVNLIRDVLDNGMYLLGVPTLERM